MPATQKFLLFGQHREQVSTFAQNLSERFDVVAVSTVEKGIQHLREGNFSGVFLLGGAAETASALVSGSGLLEQLPGGYALVDLDEQIIWSNSSLKRIAGTTSIESKRFFDVLGSPKILGPDFMPFNTAMATGLTVRTTIQVGDKTYYELQVTPVFEQTLDCPSSLIAIIRDMTTESTEREQLRAIYHAGLALGDLTPQEILEMDLPQRKELLKSKIVHFTKDLLQFETVEIRLLDKKTKRLCPLLVYGMEQEAVERELFAETHDNGVTGYVAATGNSYLCLDTSNDPLYLVGCATARSSLTVPLKRHDEILGTFNVESSRQDAFNEKDKEFLELFSREVAIALNTLELLVVQRSAAANESTSRILQRVAQPADDILVDASKLMERFIGMDPEAIASLQRILKHTRQIKQLIQAVGQEITAPGDLPSTAAVPARPLLQGRRILVVDNDDSVREAARTLLGQFHCDVETSHCGEESFSMAKAAHYDLVLVDINLSDMTGFECFSQLKAIRENLPIVLMTGFGYDPGHSIVKARQAGLKHALYKPFRLDLLLSTVEAALAPPPEVSPAVS